MRSALWLVLATALTIHPPHAAAEPPPPARDAAFEWFEAREDSIAKWAAKTLWRACKASDDEGFGIEGQWFAERVLEWDPDHRSARERLGFVRRKGAWVEDAELRAEADDDSPRKPGETDDEYRERRERLLRKYWEPARDGIVERYLEVAHHCAQKGWPLQARRAYWRVRKHDLSNAEALAGLGLQEMDGLFVPASWAPAYAKVRDLEHAPPRENWETFFGRRVHGLKGRRVTVYETTQTETCATFVRAGELAWNATLLFLGREPLSEEAATPYRALFVDEPLWEKWALAWKEKGWDDALTRSSIGTYSGHWDSYRRRREPSELSYAGTIAHGVVHEVVYHLYEERRASWVVEGLAFHVTAQAVPTSSWRCIKSLSKDYGTQDAANRFSNAVHWPELVRATVEAGDDLPLATLAIRKLSQFHLEDGLKAWSVLTWLHERDPEGLTAYVNAAAMSADQGPLFEQHLGATPEQLDEEWRAYVLRNY